SAVLEERAADEVRLVLQRVPILVLERGLGSIERGGLRRIARTFDGDVPLAVEAEGVALADLGTLHELSAGDVLADHSLGGVIDRRADRGPLGLGTRVEVRPGVALLVGSGLRRGRC